MLLGRRACNFGVIAHKRRLYHPKWECPVELGFSTLVQWTCGLPCLFYSWGVGNCPVNCRLICLKIDWFDLLAVQGTFKSLLQHHNSKESIIWHSEPLTSYAKEIGWENYLAASIGNFIMEMKVWFEELSHSKPLPQEENKSLTFFLIKKIFLIPTNTCVTGFQIYYGLVKVIHQLLQL